MTAKADPSSPMKLTVQMINLMGFVFYAALIGWLSTIGMPDKFHLSTALMMLPLLYFLVCIITSFTRHRSQSVLLTGIITHTVVMVAPIAALRAESYWPAVLFVIFAAAWFTMYFNLAPT